jgi:diguanylate cyclase (GGDEF)-like protein
MFRNSLVEEIHTVPARAINIYPELERELIGALGGVSLEPQRVDAVVSELEARLGVEVYSQLLYLLCHLDFLPLQAQAHWDLILKHHVLLSEKIGHPIDFRVAVLDYFTSVNRQIKNPKIIEIKIFQKTQSFAVRDELTGLYNYRYLVSQLDGEVRRAQRAGTPVALAIFDVDDFKWYNDRNGHLAGDRALRAVADILREQVRESDLVARYGGEEFVVLLPGAHKPQALQVARRIGEKIGEHPFPFGEHQPGGNLTVSGGLAVFSADASGPRELLDAADRALYIAKSNGKDQVLTAGNENRSCPRVRVEALGELQRLSEEKQPIVTENLSNRGLQFRCERELVEGEYFRFAMTMPQNGEEITGVAKVLRVTQEKPEGTYHVGAHIVEMDYAQGEVLRRCIGQCATEECEVVAEAE